MKTYLILDASNLIYRNFFASLNEDQEMTVAICYQMALNALSKYHAKYNATDVVVAFDMPNSWRKVYTKDTETCVTRKVYKANRRQTMTESQKKRMADLDTHIQSLADLFKDSTGLIVLKRKFLEADDLIAGFTQKFPDDKHIIVSSDKDYIQLLGNGNVSIVDPNTDKQRDLVDWDGDANYFMFEKCFRGDDGDNVQSSFPRIRKTRIQKAYVDAFERTNVMKHEFVVEYLENDELKTHTYQTEKLFEENRLLMDLTAQPEVIRELIDNTISDAVDNRGKFDYFTFVRFCGQYNLPNILSSMDRYTKLLSGKGK